MAVLPNDKIISIRNFRPIKIDEKKQKTPLRNPSLAYSILLTDLKKLIK